MSWLFFALLSPAVYAVINFTDKYIVEKEVRDYRGMPIYATIMGLVMGLIFWVVTGFPMLDFFNAAIVIATGMISVWSLALYFKALSFEETSRIIIFFQLIPVITLILSYLFLNETISFKQFIGFFLILTAVWMISQTKTKKKIQITSAFWLIILYDVLWAIASVLIKFAINLNSFSKILAYESWGIALGGGMLYLLFPSIRTAFLESIRTVRKKALVIMFVNEGVFVVAKSLSFFAYAIGPTALVSVVSSTQVFFGIVYGVILTAIAPAIFKEGINKNTLFRKIIAAIVVILGMKLVY